MTLTHRLKHEIRSMALATLYFGCWIGFLVAFKGLLLSEYSVSFYGYSAALVGVLVLAKVVLVLEHIPLGHHVRRRPAWVEVIIRTLIYSIGVALVLMLEHGLRGAKEAGGFVPAVREGITKTDAAHMLATTMCITIGLLGYNIILVLRRVLGPGGLVRIFLEPIPEAQPHGAGRSANSSSSSP